MPLVFSSSLVGPLWVYSCCWGVLLRGVFLDQSGLPFGHPFAYHSFLNAFIHVGSKCLSWMEVNFFNQFFKSCLECVGEHVHLRTFFEHSQLFPCCLSIRLFCYDLSITIFCFKIFLPLTHPVTDMASLILLRLISRIFCCCFGTFCFVCTVWSCLCIFLFFLLSPVFFGLCLQVLFFVLVAVLFQFRSNVFKCSVLAFLLVVRVFLSVIPVCVPTWVLTFCVWSSGGTLIFSQTNFARAYIESFNSKMLFVGIFVNKLFTFSVLDLLSTGLGSWEKARWFSFFFYGIYIHFFLSGQCLRFCFWFLCFMAYQPLSVI